MADVHVTVPQRDIEELKSLRDLVNGPLSDWLLGKTYPEFANDNGGIDGFLIELTRCYYKYEYDFNTMADVECE